MICIIHMSSVAAMDIYSHALVYFPLDKTITTHEVKDIFGWCDDTITQLQQGECVMLQVIDNKKIVKVTQVDPESLKILLCMIHRLFTIAPFESIYMYNT